MNDRFLLTNRQHNAQRESNQKAEPKGTTAAASGILRSRPPASPNTTSSTFSTSPLVAAARALFSDGHTYWDGVLLVSACQIGQIMLVLPRAAWLAGLVPASLVAVATLLCGIWTIHVLLALYLEYKGRLLARGQWYEVEEGDEGRIGGEGGRGEERDDDREIEVELVPSSGAAKAKAAAKAGGTSSSSSSPPVEGEELEEQQQQQPPCKRLRVTQYHDVAGELGGPKCRALVVALTGLTLFGVGVAQVLACSSNFYYISGKALASSLEQKTAAAGADALSLQSHSLSKRDYALIWGLPMCLLLFVPGYRSSRLFSVLAIAGTTFTAWYVVAASAEELNRQRSEGGAAASVPTVPPNLWPRSPRGFFVGGSVIMSALGAHTICMEVFEMLRQPVRFTSAFVLAQFYVWTLVAPQALAANVAFSGRIAGVDTVYGEEEFWERRRNRKERTRFFFSVVVSDEIFKKKTLSLSKTTQACSPSRTGACRPPSGS